MKKILLSIAFSSLLGMTAFALSHVPAPRKHKKEPPSVERLMTDLDTNKAGRLSKVEVKASLAGRFEKLDRNKAGFLTKKELENAPRIPKGERYRKRGIKEAHTLN